MPTPDYRASRRQLVIDFIFVLTALAILAVLLAMIGRA